MLANPNDDRWFEDEDVEDEEGSFSEEEEAVDAIMEMLRDEGTLAKDFGMEDGKSVPCI